MDSQSEESLQQRKQELTELLMDPEVAADSAKVREISLEFGTIEKELAALRASGAGSTTSAKKIILELRAGTGGEEAALFVRDLLAVYKRYAESKKWDINVIHENGTDIGGYKEISLEISGKGVYDHLQYESGTHRVQRIPATEKGGRIHTSAITVAVLPLTDVSDKEIVISPQDIRIDTYRASGKGGQHVNKTDSAVRITHLPTNIAVACQDERSQHKNKDKAMRILKAQLYQAQQDKQLSEADQSRKEQVGTGDRSEKIRTYNYPQNRITDHRFNKSWKNLDHIMQGSLDPVIQYILDTTTDS